MKETQTVRTTFAKQTKMTPEIVTTVTTVVTDSLSTVKERNEKGQILFQKLKNALLKNGPKKSP